ncbi:MAG: hypothetical protein P9L99_03045 [Candidatus Lernaella stagnicola]|nr:hypothetical protein [Candidatus Lernaella stagnicola]
MWRRILDSKGGKFNYVSVVLLLIVGAVMFFGVMIVPKWMADFNVKQEMYLKMVNAKTMADHEIAAAVAKYAADNNIPLSINDITCHREAKAVICAYSYDWPIAVGGFELFTWNFDAAKEREVTEVLNKLSNP